MGVSLAEALEQVELQPGRTYRCRVKDRWIEVRVLPSSEMPPPAPLDESDIRLDPWVFFPPPETGIRLRAKRGTLPPPVVPIIPSDEDAA
jgi:hypothetical protein